MSRDGGIGRHACLRSKYPCGVEVRVLFPVPSDYAKASSDFLFNLKIIYGRGREVYPPK